MNVLVTGGAGYLGCCLVPRLVERGHRVRVFDRFCFGDGVLDRLPACEVVRGDIRRLQEAPGLLDGLWDGITPALPATIAQISSRPVASAT